MKNNLFLCVPLSLQIQYSIAENSTTEILFLIQSKSDTICKWTYLYTHHSHRDTEINHFIIQTLYFSTAHSHALLTLFKRPAEDFTELASQRVKVKKLT